MIEEIELKTKATLHLATHGDINEKNAFKERVLIDWDDFGIYPIGFDPALIYYYQLKKEEIHEDFTKWLIKNFEDTIDAKDWHDFKRNAQYFLYVFGQKILFCQGHYQSLEQKLLDNLKSFDRL